MESPIISPFWQGSLDTLAQSGTSQFDFPPIWVGGNGADINNFKQLKGKTKRKIITQVMALSLVDVAKAKGDFEMIKSYWNTYHCQSRIFSAGDKLYGKYCKNRYCTVCLANRKAETINNYLPYIQDHWQQPYFVTLTRKAVSADRLYQTYQEMEAAFQLIKDKHRKRSHRGKGTKLVGLKSFECNYKPIEKTFNPHYHIIVANRQMAKTLIVDWLNHWGDRKIATPSGQMQKRVKNKEAALIEIVKYGSKIFTEPDIKLKGKNKVPPNIYIEALHHIFCVLRNERIFDRFGFNLPPKYKRERHLIQELQEYQPWEFRMELCNWFNPLTEELLTDYRMPIELEWLLENCLVTSSDSQTTSPRCNS